MPLTNQQLHEIRNIIRDHHYAFIINTIGVDAVAQEIVDDLKAKGLVNVSVQSVEEAYLYGQVVAALEDPKTKQMSYEEFQAYVQKNPIPLGDVERRAIQFAQQQAAQYVVGLGNRVDQATGQLIIEADAQLRAETRGNIQDATAENIIKRESVKKLKSNLGWAKKDWARDWDRIAITEKQVSMQVGVADGIAEKGGPDARVAKRPAPDCCEHCARLYLGPDGQPRIFKLSDLIKNGLNNFGRKARDWLPVLGAMHPFCQCQLIRIPPGWGFDESGQLVPGGELGVAYESPDDLEKAIRREAILQKAYALQGHVTYQGLDIAIENKVGTERFWTDSEGNSGSTKMLYAYGYITGTSGADEDEIDVFLGPDPDARNAYVVHQQDPGTGRYDEDKVMLGFSSSEQARHAYEQHYSRPDFYVSMSPMPMDQFKRWCGATVADRPFRQGNPMDTFVILEPLSEDEEETIQKGGKLPGYLAAAHSQAGNRNVQNGTVINQLVGARKTPPPTIEGTKPTPKEHVEGQTHARQSRVKDKADYQFEQPLKKPTERFYIPDREPFGTAIDSEEVKASRKLAEEELEDKQGKPNKAEIQKADTPIGGITPGGYKKVLSGGKVLYLPVTPAAKKKKAAAKGKGKGKVHKPVPKVPGQPINDGHVVSGTFQRQGDLKPAHAAELKRPDTHKRYVAAGHNVIIQKAGKEAVPGKLRGYNWQGRPVVEFKGKQRTLNWSEVKMVEGQDTPATFERLSRPDAMVHPSARQKKLVGEVLKLEVAPGKSAKEYMDWLRERGGEVHLVGGIVRDLLSGTTPGSSQTDEQVKSAMKDIDIITTAHPSTGVQMAQSFGHAVPNVGELKGKANSHVGNWSSWGCVLIFDGVGLDYASILSTSVSDTNNAGNGVFDHDLEDDAQRRDFTANTLSYDVYNDVIIDPLGTGIADAQAKVLRLAPTFKDADAAVVANASLPLRFWKFRARGWKAETETLDLMKEMLPKVKPTVVLDGMKKMLHKGKTIAEKKAIWKSMKQAMIEDGAGDLYYKYVRPSKQAAMEDK